MKMSVNVKNGKSRNPSNFGGFGMVPVVGLEPTRCRHQRILSACPDSEDNGSKNPSADGAALEKVPRIRAFFAKSAKNIHRVCLCGFSAFFGKAANIGGRLEVDFRERRADR
ncbi:MAG: hypothetical protein IJK01_03410 [Clostridia bacterium]|nr:hypothetical protein [Clostridia bacterium]